MSLLPDRSFFHEISQKTKYIMDGLGIDDTDTARHSRAVNRIALVLAERIHYLHAREIACLHWGSILHDIGKVGIPAHILSKQEPLTALELELIKKHPVLGYEMARMVNMPEDITDIILYHHERFDGKGYPSGIKGKEIPFLARVCSVADAFHAMISHRRPYREKLTYEEAFRELELNRGTQFDPDIVDYFNELRTRILSGELC